MPSIVAWAPGEIRGCTVAGHLSIGSDPLYLIIQSTKLLNILPYILCEHDHFNGMFVEFDHFTT